MYYVFLDTNLFVSNFQFDSKLNSRLLKYSRRNDIKLCLTYTNYMEVLKKYKDKITPEINNIKKSNIEFKKYSGKFLFDEVRRSKFYIEEYQTYLDKLMEENNIELVNHTKDFSEKIIDKYFNNEKPFDNNKPSFQDAIIWETLYDFYLDEIETDEDQIFFLTRNIKDFAKESDGDQPYELHDNLYNEIPLLKIYKDAEEFFDYEEDLLHDYLSDNFILDEEKVYEMIRSYINEELYFEIQYEIENFISNLEFEAEYFSGWGTDATEYLDSIDIIEYSKDIESGEIEVICNITYDVDFTITTKNPVYDSYDSDDFEYLKDDGGEINIAIRSNLYIVDEKISKFKLEEIEQL